MDKPKFTHFIASGGPVTEIDCWATHLALSSRGKRVLSGAMCRRERDLLAGLLGNDTLAELLRSGRPIRVMGVENGYQFEEMDNA